MAMVTAGLEDMTTHFLPRRNAWARDGRMWCMLRQGREERSRTDYRRWWEQEGIDLQGLRATSGAAETELGEEAEERGEGGVNGDRGGTLTRMGQGSN